MIVLDGGTTSLELARRLPPQRDCTVLTNSPPVAAALAEHPAVEVILIGGRLLKEAQVTVGAEAIDALRHVRADACVLGICSLHPELGVTTLEHDEAHVKRAMVESSAEVIALATADKLQHGGALGRLPAGRRDPSRHRRGRGPDGGLRRGGRERGPRMTPRAATFSVFFLNGAMIGTWVAQIPFVQERLDVSKATIGLALLCMAIGAMIAMPLTGQVLDRRSSATVTRTAALVYLPLLALPLFAPTPVLLGLALVLFGAANGAMDVSMNAHGVAVERTLGRADHVLAARGLELRRPGGLGRRRLAVALGRRAADRRRDRQRRAVAGRARDHDAPG